MSEIDDITFNLIDEHTVRRLQEDGDIELPYKRIDKIKDQRWNTKQMSSKLLQGILNGDSVPKIANSLLEVVGNNMDSAVRNARTMVTGAENRGRFDSYKELDDQGLVQEKVWIATPDSRTRASHLAVDGEHVDVKDTFSNGLEYPADPAGDPAEVYNCRCSMRSEIVGFRKKDGSISRVEVERGDTMHTSQMGDEKARRFLQGKPITVPAAKVAAAKATSYENKPLLKGDERSAQNIERDAKTNNIAYKDVELLKQELKEEEIIDKLAGGDQTKGSCASLALSYCANKVGFDVTDFRGGKSQDMFSSDYQWQRMCLTANANIQSIGVKKEAKDTAKILLGLDKNKEYMLATGRHAAIIKNTDDGLKYLELQSPIQNGWRPFEYTIKNKWGEYHQSVEDTLYNRFGCRKTVRGRTYLMEVDSFQRTEEFKHSMGYINTATNAQKKGVSGNVK